MEKRELVVPPFGTIYRLSKWKFIGSHEDEYWQVERCTKKVVWLGRLVTDAAGKPIPYMIRTDILPIKRRVLQDGCLRIHKGAYVDLYRDIYTPTN